jgi:hypothetical protein
MDKDPAFLFYYQDFMYGTRRFTRWQRGLYIELICEQADSKTGSIDSDTFESICGDTDEACKVREKFIQDANGFYNEKLRNVLEKRRKFTESRRQNLQSKGKSHMEPHMDTHMENENENDVDGKGGTGEKPNKGNCLMKNSGVTVADIQKAFSESTDLSKADAKFYFDSAMDWSDNGNMRKDWIATIRNFARRDIRDGKLKLSVYHKSKLVPGNKNEWDVPLTKGTPMPDSLKNKFKSNRQ